LQPAQFINFLENHDQVANSARGLRPSCTASRGKWRALTTLLLLLPGTPMLFQGQEFAASAPFLFFADHKGELAEAVRKGRAAFLRQFPSIANFVESDALHDPCDPATFRQCKLDFGERMAHAHEYRLHRELLRLRREDETFKRQAREGLDGAVLSPQAFVLRFFSEGHREDRLLIVNLGATFSRTSIAEPLLAPLEGHDWALAWSSEDPLYGGNGTADLWPAGHWRVPGECAVVLRPTDATRLRGVPGRRI